MASNAGFEGAVTACYDAVLDSDRWPAALQMLAESLGAASCVIRTGDDTHPFRSDQRNQPVRTPDSTEHLEFTSLWLERVAGAPDPHAERVRRFPKRATRFTVEDEITTPDERKRLPYYQEIARPGRRDWWASVSFNVKARTWCLPLYREAERGPFDPRNARHFLRTVPHLRRIISSAEQLVDIRAGLSLTTFEQVGCAAVLLDDRGCVERLNARADALLGRHLLLRHGRLRAADRLSDDRLQGVIAAAAAGVSSEMPFVAEPVAVTQNGTPWLLAETMPLTSFGHDIFAAGHTLLFFTNLTAAIPPSEETLRSAFELTGAEARLAATLATGGGIGPASKTSGISRETARTQLQAIFAKTGTRRQAELSALLSRLNGSSRR